MAYQIVKGWPAEGAIDENFSPADEVSLTEGLIAAVDSDGKLILADYDTNGSDANAQAVFIIDKDAVRGKFTGLMGKHLVEVDADHYEAGSYAPNTLLTAKDGKFDIIADSNDARPVVGKVRSVDASTGKMRILCGFGPDAVQVTAPLTAQLTETGDVPAGVKAVELAHDSTVIAATIADASNHEGLFIVKNTSSSGTAAHTLTLTSGTFNGTNDVATLNAPGEALAVWFDSAGNGIILENIDSVALSSS